jgi:hypothetical protein
MVESVYALASSSLKRSDTRRAMDGSDATCCAVFLKRLPSFRGRAPISVCFLSREATLQRPDLIVLHFVDDFGGQAFHLLGVIEEQAELDEFGSRIRDLAQTGDAG